VKAAMGEKVEMAAVMAVMAVMAVTAVTAEQVAVETDAVMEVKVRDRRLYKEQCHL